MTATGVLTSAAATAPACTAPVAPLIPAEATSAARTEAVGSQRRNGTLTSRVSGPIVHSSRGSAIARNERTIAGSKWLPAHRVSSARAAAVDIGALYERAAVIVSKASTTAITRPATLICSPASAAG